MVASYVFGRGARDYLAPLFYLHLDQIVVFPSACRRRLSNGCVSWRVYLFVGSFLSSTNCPYALRKCTWPWYPCLGNSGLVQACILLQIHAKALVTVGAPTSTTDRYLGACRSFLCGMVFLEVTCQVTSVPFFRFILFFDSNMALGTLLRGTSRQSQLEKKNLTLTVDSRQQLKAALLLA